MDNDSLERRIVDKLIESLQGPYQQSRKANEEVLRMIAKYKSRIGEDSWMQRQYNEDEKVK